MVDIPYADLEAMTVSSAPYEYRVSEITPDCKKKISAQFHIPEIILDTYLKTENAPPGHIRNNSDGTWDVGPMQINSVNWKVFYDRFDVLPIDIRYNGCINLMAGAYLIRLHLDATGKNNMHGWEMFFEVAANYHSKTPEYNTKYQERWTQNLKVLLERKANER